MKRPISYLIAISMSCLCTVGICKQINLDVFKWGKNLDLLLSHINSNLNPWTTKLQTLTSYNPAHNHQILETLHGTSEFSKDRTKDEAVKDINYVVNAQEPWNFALTTATLDTYKAGFYKDYFKSNSIVGVAKDKKVIVFNFDCDGKISAVFMAASSDLLTE